MNQSQLVLSELAGDPERAINFLKKLNILLALQKRNWSRVVIAYLLGIVSVLVFQDAIRDYVVVFLIK